MSIRRYFTIHKKLLQLNVSTLLAYRANLFNSIISTVLWGGMSIIMMLILANGSSSIYGWKHHELLLMVGVYNIIVGTFHMLFSRNFERFSQVIHLGDLDGILLKPVNAQYLMSFWLINYTSILRIMLGIVFSALIIRNADISVTLPTIFLFVFLMIVGLMFLYSIWFIITTLTMWFTTLSNLVGLLYEINGTTRFPAEMFKEIGVFVLLIFVPLTFVVNTPTKILLQKYVGYEVIILLGIAIGLFLFSRWFWQFALRHYTSASA